MVSSAEMLAAFRELSNSKQLDRTELYGLLQDGYMAALARNVILDKQYPLPEWDDLGELFGEGARMIGVVIIYIIPIIALVATFMMPAIFVAPWPKETKSRKR